MADIVYRLVLEKSETLRYVGIINRVLDEAIDLIPPWHKAEIAKLKSQARQAIHRLSSTIKVEAK